MNHTNHKSISVIDLICVNKQLHVFRCDLLQTISCVGGGDLLR